MIKLMFHLEHIDEDDEFVWWIDSPDVPGFYATANEIVDCRSRAIEALTDEGYETSDIVEELVLLDDSSQLVITMDPPSLTLPGDAQLGAIASAPRTIVRALALQ